MSNICWDCANAYANKCPWMRACHPIEGWEADKVFVNIDNGHGNKSTTETYYIMGCPKFILDKQGFCPVCRKRLPESARSRYCSDKCKNIAIKNAEAKRETGSKPKNQKERIVTCGCGVVFTTFNGRVRYCSDDCRKAAVRESFRKYAAKNYKKKKERLLI